MRYALEVLSQPAYEPVSLTVMRQWMRVDAADTSYDAVLAMLRKAMREEAENLTHRVFVQRRFRLSLECWPLDQQYSQRIYLPNPPLASVESVQYYDSSGVLQTLATDQYVVHAEYEPAFIVPAWSVVWPTTRAVPNAVQVSFTAGYSPGSPQDEPGVQETLPEKLKLWMAAKAGTLSEFREQILAGQMSVIPRNFTDGLLDSITIGTRLF